MGLLSPKPNIVYSVFLTKTLAVHLFLWILFVHAEIASGRPVIFHRHARQQNSATTHALHHAEGDSQRRIRARSQPQNDEQESQSDVEDDDDPADYGLWKVPVPSMYQSPGFGLRLRGRYLPLNTPSVTLTGRDSPEIVALQDPHGRVLERRKTTVTQHTLSGFTPRNYRISSWWGVSKFSGKNVDSGALPGAVTHWGVEGIYQPGPVGYTIGLDFQSASFASKAAPIDQRLRFASTDLRIGGVFEWGLSPRSANYRWHGLAHGGLLFGSLSITPDTLVTSTKKSVPSSKPPSSPDGTNHAFGSSKGL